MDPPGSGCFPEKRTAGLLLLKGELANEARLGSQLARGPYANGRMT